MLARRLSISARFVPTAVFGLVLTFSSVAHAQPGQVDDSRLARLLEADGFAPPERFKALVGEVRLTEGGPPNITWLDYRGTSDDRDDWWPASSVKIFAAVAALERSRALGFPPSAAVVYHYDEDGEGEEAARMRLSEIVRRAIVQSDNTAFDRLVELVGFDTLHGEFFTRRNGLGHTAFLRAYGGRHPHPETGHSINRHSPHITLVHRGHSQDIEARDGTGEPECPDQGNCTTLRELAESMRRVMLHEHLPARQQFALGDPELTLLREVLESPRRAHGMQLVEAIQRGFGDGVPLRVYHKPGYAYRWTSDVIFVHRTDTDQRFIIALAAWSGRRVLDDALERIARLAATGHLTED